MAIGSRTVTSPACTFTSESPAWFCAPAVPGAARAAAARTDVSAIPALRLNILFSFGQARPGPWTPVSLGFPSPVSRNDTRATLGRLDQATYLRSARGTLRCTDDREIGRAHV